MIFPGLALSVSVAMAQGGPGAHVLIVTGLAGEPQYRTAFGALAASVVDAAKQRWGLIDSNIRYLAEDPAIDKARITAKSTKSEILASIATIAARARPGDVVLMILLGHGSQQGDTPQLNLPGPDLSASELAAALAALGKQTTVIVNAASASGGFLPVLSAPGRVVITATKSGFERNATTFGDWFTKALTTDQADGDKNGRVSIAEAYAFARREVARSYQVGKRLLTEHAQLDDDGDGKGTGDLAPTGDGGLAKTITFALTADPAAADPRLAPLIAERRQLEASVIALRGRKPAMDSTAYDRELERLLLRLAEVNESIKAAGVKP